MAKKKKIRVELRKNRQKPPRQRGWTRSFQGPEDDTTPAQERVRAKGELSRKRTIIQEQATAAGQGPAEMPAVDAGTCRPGRVLRVHGLLSLVEIEAGEQLRCTVRRLLRTLATDERNIVATGDRVQVLPTGHGEGVIERVEPRHGLLTRASRGREHVLVANVDQVVIVMSLVEPELKPHLLDRYLVSAEQGGIAPVICLNKADLVEHVAYQPLIGLYSQLGIPTFLTSAISGIGVDPLRKLLRDRESVFTGQSGVGKSSLLNAIEPGLGLRVAEVSEATQKGRHTTTTAELLRLEQGGWVVDTPGLRQFQLWDVLPEEVEGFFPEFRPLVPLCAYPDCTHTHEDRCAVKDAVARRLVSEQRYISYLGLFTGKEA
jgi:ribosome biogenesis GTPase